MSCDADRLADSVSYTGVMNEIMRSLDAMKVTDHHAPSGDPRNKRNVPRVDVSFLSGDQTQFILSPAAPSPGTMPRDSFAYADGNLWSSKNCKDDSSNNGDVLVAASDPDLGWVNELLT